MSANPNSELRALRRMLGSRSARRNSTKSRRAKQAGLSQKRPRRQLAELREKLTKDAKGAK